ncbi:hypothetical protein F383_21405 [Gossypium arboreum]|uniref:Uncharacterized protein n=1 Tax=Gossypium arboreum TaxID=29729 RepID=A0A0B0NX18_GOSAR|nr:hypothetical protein F383_21405 [Gossypium arboreum]
MVLHVNHKSMQRRRRGLTQKHISDSYVSFFSQLIYSFIIVQ